MSRGDGGSNAVAGDTHDEGNKATGEGMWREGGKNKMKNIKSYEGVQEFIEKMQWGKDNIANLK